jgi:hypothetical protein
VATTAAVAPGAERSWGPRALHALPAAVLLLISVVVVGGRRGLPEVEPLIIFADLSQVTYNSGCTAASAGEVGATECDPLGRPYNYPGIWAAAFRIAGVSGADTELVGWTMVVLACVALAAVGVAVGRRPDWAGLVLATLALSSPPMLLMAERGNTDLVIVVLLSVAVLAALSRRTWLLSALVLALAAGLKLFPAGSILGLRRRVEWLVAGAMTAVAVAVLALPDLRAIQAGTPSYNDVSFGAGVVPSVVRGDLAAAPGLTVEGRDQLLGLVCVALVLAVVLLVRGLRRRVLATAAAVAGDGLTRVLFMVGAGAFLTAYALTTSFDYRLFTLVFVVLAGLRVRAGGPRVLAVWAVVSLWTSYWLPRSLEFVGDVGLIFFAGTLAAVVLVVVVGGLPGPAARLGLHAALPAAGAEPVRTEVRQ